jgi:NAD-dependent dihydropyrimidine dehydrogenase PreA subunit
MGLQPRLLVSPRTVSIRSAILAHRLLSTSTCSHAQHTQGPPNSNSHDGLSSGVTSRTRHIESAPARYDAHGNELNPYAGGQSAIDKAVHLFFFTEIIRGAAVSLVCPSSILTVEQGCGLFWRTSSARRTQSCILLRKDHSLLVSAENMHSADTQVERSAALVSQAGNILFLHVIMSLQLANYVRLFALHRLSQLKVRLDWTAQGKQPNMVRARICGVISGADGFADIDMTKCIYCGFCAEACPVDAIVESEPRTFYLHLYSERCSSLCSPKPGILDRNPRRTFV